MRSAVLFLVFNRPETTRQVFDAIRAAQPPRLYIAADGPRPNRPGELERCNEVRAVAKSVDWPCEVKTLFRDHNLGCKLSVSGGIAWFFDHESEGVIVEDDVLPVSTFFEYCDELLEKYRNDERIGSISGSNLISNHFAPEASYFFSRYPNIWGWASWRRAWRRYDVALTEWPAWRDGGGLRTVFGGKWLVQHYWRGILNSTYAGKVDTWDYQWFFACWRHGGLTILPSLNQTRNLGYGAGATHTVGDTPEFVVASAAKELAFPLIHPGRIEPDSRADALIESKFFSITVWGTVKRYVRRAAIFRRLGSLFE